MGALFRWLWVAHLLGPAAMAATCSPATMKATDSQKGTLNERDCRMSDAFPNLPGEQAFVDLYTIAIRDAGLLSVEATSSQFSAQVRLYDARGRRLGGAESSPRLRAEVQTGQYTLYVTSEGVRTGTYTVATTFKATPVCTERRVAPNDQNSGDLSLGDCRHPISIKQRGTLIAELQAADAELILRQGRAELQKDAARVAREVEGDYTLVVHPLRQRGGAYTLRTVFCPGSQELILNTPVEGRVSDACRAAIGDGPQTYSLKLGAAALISLELHGRGLEPAIKLSGPGVEKVAGKPPLVRALGAGSWSIALDAPKGAAGSYSLTARSLCALTEIKPNSAMADGFVAGGCNSAAILNTRESSPAVVYNLHTDQSCELRPSVTPVGIAQTSLLDLAGKPLASPLLNPGEYLLVVSALAPGTRQFRVDAACPRVCAPGELRLNEIQDGRLLANECRLRDFAPSPDASPASAYRFNLPRTATVLFELSGAEAGASVMLWKVDGDTKELFEGGRSIRRALEGGSYFVIVKAANPLAYKLRASVPCTSVNLQTDQPASYSLSEGDCYDGTDSYYRRFRVLPDQTAVLELTAASKAFDPVLQLSDATGVLASTTGAAGQRPAAIRRLVEPGGDYAVQIHADNPAGLGAFDLVRKLFRLRELEPNQPGPVAEFVDLDCLESTCVHYYRVRLEGDIAIRLNMKVPFASNLELLDANWNTLEKADSQIRSHIKSDRYMIRVSTKNKTYGSYVLIAGAAGN